MWDRTAFLVDDVAECWDEDEIRDAIEELTETFFATQRGQSVEHWEDGEGSRLRDRELVDGRPASYVCRDFACQLPATEPEELRELLEKG